MSVFNSWSDADQETFERDFSTFEDSTSLGEVFLESFSQSMEEGPTASVYRWAKDKFMEDNLTGAEANEKYGLTGTSKAFDPDEKVSDYRAEVVASRHFDTMAYQQAIQNAMNNEGETLTTATNFIGGMAGGFIDPTAIIGGGVAAKAVRAGLPFIKAGVQARKLSTFGEVAAINFAENLVGSVAVDGGLMTLGESFTKQEIPLSQKVMNILGGTMFGTVVGTGLEYRAVRQQQRLVTESNGSKSAKVLEEQTEHAMNNVANGKKPNPDFIQTKENIKNHTERAGQSQYVKQQVTQETIKEHPFFAGKELGEDVFDQPASRGDSAVVLTDNHNLASNRVTPPVKGGKGEMTSVIFDDNVKFATDDIIDDAFREEFMLKSREVIKDELGATALLDDSVFIDTDTVDDFLNILRDWADKFEDLPNADDIMNKILYRMDYDGYVTQITAPEGFDPSNGLVLFKKEDGSLSGVKEFTETYETTFDPEHPANKSVVEKLNEADIAEASRLQSHKSDLDYDELLMEEANSVKDPTAEEANAFDEFLETEGIDKTDLEQMDLPETLGSDLKALSTPEQHYNGLKTLARCIIDAFKGL